MFCHKWKGLTLFQADAQYKALEGEHPSLANLEGQLHAQERLGGVENLF